MHSGIPSSDLEPKYKDLTRSIEQRVDDLVSRMTLEEKISQMVYDAPAIERLEIPKYNWWNECLHGMGRAGVATVFPQAIGLAAMWNEPLMQRVEAGEFKTGDRVEGHRNLALEIDFRKLAGDEQ